jgi:hypothetical protein
MAEQVGNWYHYSGAVHIHTTASDGTLPLAEVIAIGRKVGLDFMLFTDHMGLANREAGGEGIHGNTLVLIGYEHNDPEDNNHYLVFQSPGVYPENLSTREYVSGMGCGRFRRPGVVEPDVRVDGETDAIQPVVDGGLTAKGDD